MPSVLGKWLPIIVQISLTKRQCWVRVFSHFDLFDSQGPFILLYYDEAHAACGMCVQLSSYMEVCMYRKGRKAGWESGNKTAPLNVNQNPAY